MKHAALPLLIAALLAAIPTFAGEVVHLRYGINEVDINDDGVMDIILKTRWEGAEDTSFDRYLLAAHLDDRWVEIPLGDKVDDTLQTDEGGGCTLRDFMFIKTDAGPLMVREYKREFGRGYDAAMPVHVTTYDLHSNEVERPSLRFKQSFKSTPTGIYCDVRSLMR